MRHLNTSLGAYLIDNFQFISLKSISNVILHFPIKILPKNLFTLYHSYITAVKFERKTVSSLIWSFGICQMVWHRGVYSIIDFDLLERIGEADPAGIC